MRISRRGHVSGGREHTRSRIVLLCFLISTKIVGPSGTENLAVDQQGCRTSEQKADHRAGEPERVRRRIVKLGAVVPYVLNVLGKQHFSARKQRDCCLETVVVSVDVRVRTGKGKRSRRWVVKLRVAWAGHQHFSVREQRGMAALSVDHAAGCPDGPRGRVV